MARSRVPRVGPKNADQFLLRLPKGMRAEISSRADANGRSINSEIIAAINQHLERDTLAELADFINKHRVKIERL